MKGNQSISSSIFTRSLPARPTTTTKTIQQTGAHIPTPPISTINRDAATPHTKISDSAVEEQRSISDNVIIASNQTRSTVSSIPRAEPPGMEGWRSFVLDLEASLREVATIGSKSKGTSVERINKVFDLFNAFIQASPNIEQILRLFKHEFTKAVYEPIDGPMAVPSDATFWRQTIGTPYFDLVEIERREKAILATELDVIEAESSVEDLKKQVLKLQSLIPFYEHEISRLTKDNQRLDEELKRTKYSSDVGAQQHHSAYSALDEDYQRLTRENRELLLEIQKLKKTEDAFGARGVATAYNHLKNRKMDVLQHMFERGDQEASLLLLSHQLESTLNTVLTEADRQFHRCSEAEIPSVRAKLVRNTVLILEEMHEIEERRSVLLRTAAETGDWKDTLVEAHLRPLGQLREAAPKKIAALIGDRTDEGDSNKLTEGSPYTPNKEGGAQQKSTKGEVVTQKDSQFLASSMLSNSYPRQHSSRIPDNSPLLRKNTTSHRLHQNDILLVSEKRPTSKEEWVSKAFASLAPSPSLNNVFNASYADPSMVFSKRVVAPLADVSATKFLSGVELFASQAPGDAEYVQTVQFMDPTHSIQLPLKSTHVKLKFMQPMRKEVRTRYGEHLPKSPTKGGGNFGGEGGNGSRRRAEGVPNPVTIQGNIADRTHIISWLNEKLDEAGQTTSAPPQAPFAQVAVADRPHANSQMEGVHWRAYKTVFGGFVPYLPRLLPVEYLDLLMLRAFRLLKKKIRIRYDHCLDTAVGRSSSIQTAKMFAERLFREAYDEADLQISLLEVIEGYYCYPEQVAKVFFEVLSSLEMLASTAHSKHTGVYLQCLGGKIPPAAGHFLSLMMHSITLCWPGTTLSADEPLDEREVPMFLKMVFSNDDGIFRLTLDDLITDLLVNTNRNLTRSSIRSYFASGIEEQREYLLAAQMSLLTRKSVAIQWAELDFEDFADVNHETLGDTAALFCEFLYACCTLNKTSRIPPREVAYLAVLAMKEQR